MGLRQGVVLFGVLCHSIMMSEKIAIDQYDPVKDWEAVHAILDAYPDQLTFEAHGKPEGSTEQYLASSKTFTVVLRIDGTIVAIIAYGFFNATFSMLRSARCGFIQLLGVAKGYQRKGYGRTLVNHALEVYKQVKISTVYIDVDRENDAARALYGAIGFRPCVNIPSEFSSNNANIILLEITLSAASFPIIKLLRRYPATSLALMSIAGLLFWKIF